MALRVNKEDYIAWMHHPVSQAFLEAMKEHIDNEVAALAVSAGENPMADRKKVGIIEGLQWLVDWTPEFIEENDDN